MDSNLDSPRTDFAQRLVEVCEDMNLPARGRQTQLAKKFGVSQQAARKWLDGIAYPEIDKLVAMADWANINVNWLLQGVGPKHGNRVDAKALVLDEAVKLLPRELGLDLVDNLRAKLERVGKLRIGEPSSRYSTMLEAYEHEIARKPN